MVAMAAVESGSTMRRRMPKYPSPSISAASSISLGMLLKKLIRMIRLNELMAKGISMAARVPTR